MVNEKNTSDAMHTSLYINLYTFTSLVLLYVHLTVFNTFAYCDCRVVVVGISLLIIW